MKLLVSLYADTARLLKIPINPDRLYETDEIKPTQWPEDMQRTLAALTTDAGTLTSVKTGLPAVLTGVSEQHVLGYLRNPQTEQPFGRPGRPPGALNTKAPKNNTTGFVGVYYLAARGRYKACIFVDGSVITLGAGYKTAQEAADARKAAILKETK